MADEDPDSSGSARSYHKALGLFIEAFASTEGYLHILLCNYANISPSVGRALFSDTRTGQAIDLIERIVSVNDPGEPRESDLATLLQQLKFISEVRNKIVHFVPLDGIPGDVRHLTNQIRARTEKHRRDIAISAAMLEDMAGDLQKIQLHIWYHLLFDRVPSVVVAMLDEMRCAPWRYQPPRQIKRTKSPREQKRREGARKGAKVPGTL